MAEQSSRPSLSTNGSADVVQHKPRIKIPRMGGQQMKQLCQKCVINCIKPIDELMATASQLSLKVDTSFIPTTVRSTPSPDSAKAPTNKKRKKKRFCYSVIPTKQQKIDLKTYISEEHYMIEAIVDVKINKNFELMFCIKWMGYSTEENTWQSVEDLFGCDPHYESFHRKQFIKEAVDYNYNDFEMFVKCLQDAILANGDTAVILKLNNKTTQEFDRSDSQLRVLKNNLKPYLCAMQSMNTKLSTDEMKFRHKFWPQKILIQHLVQEMNIETNFGGLRKMFVFVSKRKEVLIKLEEWERDFNQQMFENGSTEDRISLENNVDLEVPPELRFLTSYKMHTKVELKKNVDDIKCKCLDDCQTAISCVCKQKVHKDERFVSAHLMYECNKYCVCSDNCPNRRLQKGRIGTDLMLFKTDHKGWGVMSRKPILKDSFVCQYMGEVLDSLRIRGRIETYFFNINEEFCGQTLFIDADFYANISRFINHSCAANMTTQLVVANPDEKVPRIGFFAKKDIKAYEELTYDYNNEILSINKNGLFVSDNSNNQLTDEGSTDSGYQSSMASHRSTSQPINVLKMPCFCGTAKCRRFI